MNIPQKSFVRRRAKLGGVRCILFLLEVLFEQCFEVLKVEICGKAVGIVFLIFERERERDYNKLVQCVRESERERKRKRERERERDCCG